MEVTVNAGAGVYVRHGGEMIWQQPTSTVRVDGAVRILVTGTRSEVVTSAGCADVSDDVPAKLIFDGDHSAIVEWWQVEMTRQTQEAETVRMEAERDDAIRRLARKARAEGVQLYRDAKDGRYYASSVSHPGKMHYLTGVSCDCMGFASHGRCKHHSALLVALGWVDDSTFEPDPIAITGTGEITRSESEQVAA